MGTTSFTACDLVCDAYSSRELTLISVGLNLGSVESAG